MQGILEWQTDGRWHIVSGDMEKALVDGDLVSLFIAGRWIPTRICLSTDGKYFALERGVQLERGLLASIA